MNVASLELCKELYELSGWNTHISHGVPDRDIHPVYDLGFLLRKFPKKLKHPATGEEYTLGLTWHLDEEKWIADYQRSLLPHAEADTPENAAAKLAISLFKANILTKEDV